MPHYAQLVSYSHIRIVPTNIRIIQWQKVLYKFGIAKAGNVQIVGVIQTDCPQIFWHLCVGGVIPQSQSNASLNGTSEYLEFRKLTTRTVLVNDSLCVLFLSPDPCNHLCKVYISLDLKCLSRFQITIPPCSSFIFWSLFILLTLFVIVKSTILGLSVFECYDILSWHGVQRTY